MKEITRSDQLPDWLRERIKAPMWDTIMEQLERDVHRNFDLHRRALVGRVKRAYREDKLVQGYHDRAMLAELEKLKMGRLLEKAQQRIGRQRKANREMQERVKQLEHQLDVANTMLENTYRGLHGDY